MVFSCPNFKLVTNYLIKNPSDDYFLYGPVYWDSKAKLVMEQIYPKETFFIVIMSQLFSGLKNDKERGICSL